MTILNFAFDGQQALFVTDELGAEEHPACIKAGRHVADCRCVVGRRSKVLVLPHLRGMAGFSGESALMDLVYTQFGTRTPENWAIDDMLVELSVSLRLWQDRYRSEADNLALVCHCHADGRVAAWALAGPKFNVTPLEAGLYLLPAVEIDLAPTTIAWPQLEAAIVGAVSRQSVLSDILSGGHLNFTHLNSSGFTVRWSDETLPRNLGGIP